MIASLYQSGSSVSIQTGGKRSGRRATNVSGQVAYGQSSGMTTRLWRSAQHHKKWVASRYMHKSCQTNAYLLGHPLDDPIAKRGPQLGDCEQQLGPRRDH